MSKTMYTYRIYNYNGKLLTTLSTRRAGESALNILLANSGYNPDFILWNEVS